ncbi:SAM-dependent methyltransferase [Planotetraspora sp. A-T 1434]|uniref:SAM-dependent methyltransferase n=1 Tax=Planotetraspora sp. A-T 1434 TaxID=2979219 RepID=UPI0021C0011F|nr:SAM-dependent methyltransferase [Planotetraspora sp. A-T 1434]MCT9932927.1 SAM-dependent methyltransferase [Planotetraspora sp. A-T 1434]
MIGAITNDFDSTRPNVARMYDYYLGGKDHYAADRACAEEVIRHAPQARDIALANRAFLGRAVRFLAGEAGIGQFLDIGAGLPTRDNVHEVAQRVNPASRVVYVDNDPVVLIHARALLATDAQTRAIAGDVRKPSDILTHPDMHALLDSSKPVAVLLVAVLHFIPDDQEPYAAVRTLVDAMAPGSYLVVSHAEQTPELQGAAKRYERANAPAVLRSVAEIRGFFEGLELVDPGLVNVRRWRPEVADPWQDPNVPFFGAVGVKP